MTRQLTTLGLALAFALALTGCSSTTPSATVSSVVVTGTTVGVGLTVQFTATATMSDGTTQNVTSAAAWQSSNPAVATVALGLVTGVTDGQTTITATYQGLSATDVAQVGG
jgi:ABC-type glycerol-3-phosphate transport system substrate-binding protein